MPVSTVVTGMVLSAMPVGDFDKRLVILTKELGKISAFAKGARKPNSALMACSQPFSFGEFSLYAGRSSYTIIGINISNYFPDLRNDIESVYYGLYFCEFAEYITKENIDGTDILKLLYQTLRAVSKKTIKNKLIRAVFELKAMALSGEAPQVFQCVKCGKSLSKTGSQNIPPETGGTKVSLETLKAEVRYCFSVECGGILCMSCQVNDKHAISLNNSTLYAMQYIISREIENLYTFAVTDEILEELRLCVRDYLKRYIDHEFKALELIKTL